MQNVAADLVLPRPLRPEPASGRVGAHDRTSGTFDAMIDPAPRTERAARPRPADRPERAERPANDRNAARAQDSRAKDARAQDSRAQDARAEAQDARQHDAAERPGAPQDRNSTQSAETSAPEAKNQVKNQVKDQAKNSQASDNKRTDADQEKAEVETGLSQAAADVVATANAALLTAEGDAETVSLEATDTPVATDVSVKAGDDAQAFDAKPADVAAAIVIAAVLPVPTASAPTQSTEVAAIAPAGADAAPAPVDPADAPATPAIAAADAKDAAPKPAKPEATVEAGEQAETPIQVLPKGADTTPAKSAAERKADRADKAKSDQHGHIGHAAAKPGSDQVAAAAQAPAETQAKPSTPREARAEIAAIRGAPAEARGDSAAPTAAPSPAGAVANAPIMPFSLALSSSLAAPTMWPTTALRIDAPGSTPVPVAGLAVEIVARAQDGLNRFDIRLDPAELGRIDVRLDVDQGGKVTSHLMADRAETLDLLRRDAPQLERALQQAGLNTEGGLQFSLRDQSFAGRDQDPRQGANQGANASHLIIPEDEQAASEAARRGYGRMVGLGSGVDIRV